MLVTLIKTIIMFLVVALAVGYLTMWERKALSYIQLRKGPNKVSLEGDTQPLADALKLFVNEAIYSVKSSSFVFNMVPMLGVFLMFSLWFLYSSAFYMPPFKLCSLYLLVISSMSVFIVLLSGWASNSKYSLLGALRAVAQTISYEISMALVFLVFLFVTLNLNFMEWRSHQGIIFFLGLFPIVCMWVTIILAETNRAPFDLAEGESELVSGYNIEYGSGKFSLLFIAEYGSVLVLSVITSCMTMGSIDCLATQMFFIFVFLWTRASYPRIRYDQLMQFAWKTLLTLALGSLFFVLVK